MSRDAFQNSADAKLALLQRFRQAQLKTFEWSFTGKCQCKSDAQLIIAIGLNKNKLGDCVVCGQCGNNTSPNLIKEYKNSNEYKLF